MSKTGCRIARISGPFVVLFLCLLFIGYLYEFNILPDKQARTLFQRTDCFLISKKLNVKGHIIHRYRADFLISYNVTGVQYNHWVSGNGLDTAFSQNEGTQEDILTQFDVGGTYPCWFNPDNPQEAILIKRNNWLSTFPLLVPILIALFMLYFIFKNIRQLISNKRNK